MGGRVCCTVDEQSNDDESSIALVSDLANAGTRLLLS